MTPWILARVSWETGRFPLSAYDTVLRETPARLAISPMFTGAPCRVIEPVRLFRGTTSAGWPIVEPVRVK
jgi:hypothetical protein